MADAERFIRGWQIASGKRTLGPGECFVTRIHSCHHPVMMSSLNKKQLFAGLILSLSCFIETFWYDYCIHFTCGQSICLDMELVVLSINCQNSTPWYELDVPSDLLYKFSYDYKCCCFGKEMALEKSLGCCRLNPKPAFWNHKGLGLKLIFQ